MWKQKLCMCITPTLEMSAAEQIRMFAETGFEAVSGGWDHGVPVAEHKKAADECGVEFQSIHAPFHKDSDVSKMWLPGEEGKTAAKVLCECLEVCSDNVIGIMVSHVYIGFNYAIPDKTTADIGIENFGTVVKRAAELGVTVAFENTEGEEFLDILMNAFRGEKYAGFCWDTGHEQCYNRGRDMMALYGDKLVATHLNDNLGVRSFDGVTVPRDDLHLLPFDGITDWRGVADKLDAFGYTGIMTFELKRRSHKGRHDNDIYLTMPPEMYVAEAYKRACRLAAMRKVKQI